jgi:hypothetical protein
VKVSRHLQIIQSFIPFLQLHPPSSGKELALKAARELLAAFLARGGKRCWEPLVEPSAIRHGIQQATPFELRFRKEDAACR